MAINTNKLVILTLALLVFSCNKDSTVKNPSDTLTNCNTIHLRQDNYSTFYESNPTYNNIDNESYNWEFSSFAEAHLDSAKFSSGVNALENHSTLLSFLLIKNNKIVYEKYFNGSNKNHSNNIHSASKCILSALIGIAIDKDIIENVDQKVLDFFPDYDPNDDVKKQITIKHLLNMTSGFEWEEDYTEYIIEGKNNWINSILNLPMANIPGDVFNYSTGNTHLLSAILQKATDKNACEFLYSNLMNDLGIIVEHWGKDPQGYFSGGYNFYITPRELAQFGLLYLNGGINSTEQIISNKWIDASLSSQIDVDDSYDYSYCWWVTIIAGIDIYKAWGYGGQYLCIIPDLNIIIVSTANTSSGAYDQFDIDGFIADYVIPAVQ